MNNLIDLDIMSNITLADKNWFGTGGKAQFYAEPTTALEFREAVLFAHRLQLPIFVLGEGANILINDAGFNGLVIRPMLQEIEIVSQSDTHAQVRAGAGVPFGTLITFCLQNNLVGLEEFSGIPGTVGGSVFINIHFFQFLLHQFLAAGTVVNRVTGDIQEVPVDWFAFEYNYSKLHEAQHYLVDATFILKKVSPIEAAYAHGRSDEMIRYRGHRYPKSRTCGSFFRNFYESEVTLESNGKKLIYIAYYLDKLGIKGQLSSGNAIISHQHANMIVTREGATTADVINLARTMQEMVHSSFGILPQPECRLIGFAQYPLLII